MKLFLARIGFWVLSLLSLCIMTTARAEPPVGVTPTLIGRGTYGAFNLQADARVLELAAEAKRPVDIVVRTHDYAPGSSTGWHSHPGPVFITF
jgi:hypothetical protein